MAVTNMTADGNYIPYGQFGDTGAIIPWSEGATVPTDPAWNIPLVTTDNANTDPGWTVTPNIAVGRVYNIPDCKEAITILEEAEYELKELLKKNPAVKNIEIALRSVQASLRALLKVG